MTTEQKALAMVREEDDWGYLNYDAAIAALCRAIEQHEATKQEVERLNGLITATADHWLTLQVKHPIQWEGAINSAMAAACAEIEKHEAFRQEVSDAVTALLDVFKGDSLSQGVINGHLHQFILPTPKPDPLVEVIKAMQAEPTPYVNSEVYANRIHKKLDALGFEIREKNDD